MNKFITTKNEEVFNAYAEIKQMPKTSLAQYKSAYCILCDMLCGENIDKLTATNIADAIDASPTRKNHINSMVLDIYAHNICGFDKTVIYSLLDVRMLSIIKRLNV